MKNKKLLLLGTFALVFTSGLAAAGTTFAWYQTNRNASLSFIGAEIENYDSHLLLEYVGSENGFTVPAGTKNNFAFSGVNRVTDISGDGIDFYKPYWSSVQDRAAEIIPAKAAAPNVASGFYIDFMFKVSRTHEDDGTVDGPLGGEAYGLKVYLGDGTEIVAKDTGNPADVNAVKAVRMAVLHYDDGARTNPEVKYVYAPEAEADAKYLKKTEDPAHNTYNHEGYNLESQALETDAFKTEDFQEDATYEVADLMGTVTEQYIGFRFWIEGTDVHTTRELSLGGAFNVDLKLYALHDKTANLPQL